MERKFTLEEVRNAIHLVIGVTTGTAELQEAKDEASDIPGELQALIAMELTTGMMNLLTKRAKKAEKENKILRERLSRPNISLLKDGEPMNDEDSRKIGDILRDMMNDSAESD